VSGWGARAVGYVPGQLARSPGSWRGRRAVGELYMPASCIRQRVVYTDELYTAARSPCRCWRQGEIHEIWCGGAASEMSERANPLLAPFVAYHLELEVFTTFHRPIYI
jgi:hypothetical protein